MRIGIGTSIVGSNFIGGEREYIDDVGGLPTAAYSVFKVVSTYTDAVVEIRRTVSAVTVEADVAFDGDTITLDSAVTITSGSSSATTLGEFVAASGYTDVDSLGSAQDAFVATWYDQAGSNDATQTTANDQPKIVNAGALVTENGKVALDFDGVDDYFQTSLTLNEDFSVLIVHKLSVNGTYVFIASDTGGTSAQRFATRDVNGFGYEIDNPDTVSGGNQSLNLSLATLLARTTDEIFLNGSEIASGTSGNETFSSIDLFARKTSDSFFFNGVCQELIIYNSDKSALRTAIEDNINGRFNIYT